MCGHEQHYSLFNPPFQWVCGGVPALFIMCGCGISLTSKDVNGHDRDANEKLFQRHFIGEMNFKEEEEHFNARQPNGKSIYVL
ncbi:MAG: hypothetical protein MK089_04445 [Phycisphaerales bacterium]|nr:hypothetical protein [Phycisphaerales bacterium]